MGRDNKQNGEGDVVTVEIDSNNDEGSDAATKATDSFNHLSRKELIKQLQRANISTASTGSVPKSDSRSHLQTSDEEESMSIDGSSSVSSSGSSAELSEEGSNGNPNR